MEGNKMGGIMTITKTGTQPLSTWRNVCARRRRWNCSPPSATPSNPSPRPRASTFSPISLLDTTESIDRWNRGELPVALIHPASAGHGLNLQAGSSTLVWFGLTWSLELYQQTNARLWRQGQTDTVVIHHIIASRTIDERIMKALGQKEKTQSALIDAVKANLEVGT